LEGRDGFFVGNSTRKFSKTEKDFQKLKKKIGVAPEAV